jgi:hypothetical protein
MFWNIAGEFFSPKNMTSGSHKLYFVLNAALCSSPSLIWMLLYPSLTSSLVKILALLRSVRSSVISGRGILIADCDVVNMPIVLYWSQLAIFLLYKEERVMCKGKWKDKCILWSLALVGI